MKAMRLFKTLLVAAVGGLIVGAASTALSGPPVKMPRAPSEDIKSYTGAACQPVTWSEYEKAEILFNRIFNLSYIEYLYVTCPIVRDDVKGTDGAKVRVSIDNYGGQFMCAVVAFDIDGNTVAHTVKFTTETGGRILTLDIFESAEYGFYAIHCEITPRSKVIAYRIYEHQNGYDDMTDYDN